MGLPWEPFSVLGHGHIVVLLFLLMYVVVPLNSGMEGWACHCPYPSILARPWALLLWATLHVTKWFHMPYFE